MAQPKQAAKPFLRGGITDGKTLRTALSFFGGLAIMAFLNLVLTATFVSLGAAWLRVLFCVSELLIYYCIGFYSGQNRGADAVALGETAWNRVNAGKEVPDAERRLCWHPLKGLANAVIGSLPFLIPAVIHAILARRQTFSPGVLPNWVSDMASRPDVLEPLTVYTQTVPAGFADILRVVVRALVMPFVGIAGGENFDAILLIDRLSPLFVLLPAFSYAVGYLLGPSIRTRVHAAVSEGENKRRRKEQRERRRRQAQRRPNQLN